MSTTIQHFLHRASKAPEARVDAYLDRPAIGSVTVDGLVSFATEDPQQLFALADAALKAGQDLERQQSADALDTAVAQVGAVEQLEKAG